MSARAAVQRVPSRATRTPTANSTTPSSRWRRRRAATRWTPLSRATVSKRRASAGFRILGLWLQPATLTVDMSMNAGRTVNLTLRNIGDVALTGLQYAVEDVDPADPLTASVDPAGLPDQLAPGAQVTVPVVLASTAGTAPATPAAVQRAGPVGGRLRRDERGQRPTLRTRSAVPSSRRSRSRSVCARATPSPAR